MKKTLSNNLEPILYAAVLSAALWCSVTTAIMAFKNPEMTQTQLFLAIPKSFMLNFER